MQAGAQDWRGREEWLGLSHGPPEGTDCTAALIALDSQCGSCCPLSNGGNTQAPGKKHRGVIRHDIYEDQTKNCILKIQMGSCEI